MFKKKEKQNIEPKLSAPEPVAPPVENDKEAATAALWRDVIVAAMGNPALSGIESYSDYADRVVCKAADRFPGTFEPVGELVEGGKDEG